MHLQYEIVWSLLVAVQTCELLLIFMLVFDPISIISGPIDPPCISLYINNWVFLYKWM